MRSKKAADLFTGVIIFLVLNVLFFGAMFLFVGSAGTGQNIVEETYAKQIALVIDNLEPGVEVRISLEEVYRISRKNNIDTPVIIDTDANNVIVRVAKGDGHKHLFFTQ